MDDYGRWSEPVLRQMTNSKRVPVPARKGGEPDRQDHINALRTADHPSLEFLGLPPELRLIVYRELLLFDRSTSSRDLVVLRLCKHIYDEAAPVLYDENVFHINVWGNRVTLQGKQIDFCNPGLDKQVRHLLWPDGLRNVRRLRISSPQQPAIMFPQATFNGANEVVMNRTLYSLCASLTGQHHCKSFELDLRHLMTGLQAIDYEAVAYPLTMLGATESFTILKSDTDVMRLSESAISGQPHHGDALTPATALIAEAEAYVVLELAARNLRRYWMLTPSRQTYPRDWECFKDTTDHLKTLLRSTTSYDERWEYPVRTATMQLQNAMNRLDVENLLGPKNAHCFEKQLLAIEKWRRDRAAGGIGEHPVPEVLMQLRKKLSRRYSDLLLWENEERITQGFFVDPDETGDEGYEDDETEDESSDSDPENMSDADVDDPEDEDPREED